MANNVTFHTSGILLSLGDYAADRNRFFTVTTNIQELEDYVQDILSFAKRGQGQYQANASEEEWEFFEERVRSFFSYYDEEFFEQNNLVLATVDQGSSSVRYELVGLENDNGFITINVRRSVPGALILDTVTWFLALEIDKMQPFTGLQVNLTTDYDIFGT